MVGSADSTEASEDRMHMGKPASPPDLKISRLNKDTWQVAPVSHQARNWLAKHVPEEDDKAERLETDVREINRLAALARRRGLVIEFHGPHDTFHL
jgi:hypothetical protein